MMGAFNMGQCGPYFESFASGRGAAATVFSVIDRYVRMLAKPFKMFSSYRALYE